MLSLTCKAAIKAVIYIGTKFPNEKKSSMKEVAEFIGENEHTVGKLLQKLSKEDIIKSIKGPNGGFYITAKQKSLKVISVIEAIDGKDVFELCGLGLTKCSEKRPCPLHNDFKPVREMFKKMCMEKKISDLYENVNNGLSFLIP
ncbi:MAG: Rrf2 family transcriptional regulator [Bacteroidia bacterium]|nr:Rrf2 family transcriptional regulator [Bacteroidia bacterium]